MWYRMIWNVVFVVFWGTLLRPIVGAVVSIPNSTALQNVPWLCASREVLGDFVGVSRRDMCPKDKLIRRRNYV